MFERPSNICSLALKHMFVALYTYVRLFSMAAEKLYGSCLNCLLHKLNLGELSFKAAESTPVDKNISGIFPALVYLLTFSPLIVQCPPNTSSIVRILS